MSEEIAKTIISQMGGKNRLVSIVNMNGLVYGEDGSNTFIQFNYMSNTENKSNKIKITYMSGSDLYLVEFYNVINGKVKLIEKIEDIYADQLIHLFQMRTGLCLAF